MNSANFEETGTDSDINEIADAEKKKFEIEGDRFNYPQNEKEYQLPLDYGDTKVTLLVQNPYWLYVFWEFSESTKIKIANLSAKGAYIRIYYADTDKYYDTEIKIEAGSWYLQIPETNRPYFAEIGVLEKGGNFVSLARSNPIIAPPDNAAGDPGQSIRDSKDLFGMSGGDWIGKVQGSEQKREN